jgi:MoxR-like ATPase
VERLPGRDRDVSVSSVSSTWDRSANRQAPVIVVEQPDSHLDSAKLPRKNIPFQLHKEYLSLDKDATSEVLTTRWHRQSDQAIQSTISKLDFHDPSSDAARHPYHVALRILSSALSNMRKTYKALEDDRALLQEKETARKERADQLLRELPPSERDVARRILQSLFPDDNEHIHRIQRRQSNLVSPHLISHQPLERSDRPVS